MGGRDENPFLRNRNDDEGLGLRSWNYMYLSINKVDGTTGRGWGDQKLHAPKLKPCECIIILYLITKLSDSDNYQFIWTLCGFVLFFVTKISDNFSLHPSSPSNSPCDLKKPLRIPPPYIMNTGPVPRPGFRSDFGYSLQGR